MNGGQNGRQVKVSALFRLAAFLFFRLNRGKRGAGGAAFPAYCSCFLPTISCVCAKMPEWPPTSRHPLELAAE